MAADTSCPLPAAAQALIDGDPKHHVLFLGSGVSLFKPTSLPSWWRYIQLCIAALGGAAGEDGAAAAARVTTALDGGGLPPYKVTDVFARKLGGSYLSIMSAFIDAEPNSVHSYVSKQLLFSRVRAVVTTNFDCCIEEAARRQGGDVIRLTGDWDADSAALDAQWERHVARRAASAGAADSSPLPRPLVAVPTFAAFQSVGRVMTLLGQDSHAWLFKMHGCAREPSSCIDTDFQRLQGLPSHVTDVLTSLLHQLPFLFLGFGGGDLERDPEYVRLRSESDQARIAWMLREADAEPAALFGRLRGSLGERFTVIRGSLAGEIDGSGIAAMASRMGGWAREYIGPLWAAITLDELCVAAGVPRLDVAAYAGLSSAPSASTAGAARSHTSLLRSLVQPATSPAASVASAARREAITAAVRRQLDIAGPCETAIAALTRLSGQIEAAAAAGAEDDAVDPPLATTAVHHAATAVLAQRRSYADSRDFPDAWLPLGLLGAAFDAAAQPAAAAEVWGSAAAVAELAGNDRAARELEAAWHAAKDAAAGVAAGQDGGDAAAALMGDDGFPLAPAAAFAPSAAANAAPSSSSSSSSSTFSLPPPGAEDTIVFLPAFDNVGSFAQQGVSAASVLRAHLHRALLTGDRIAVGPNFLLNCRPFLSEVLVKRITAAPPPAAAASPAGTAAAPGDSAPSSSSSSTAGASSSGSIVELHEEYLHCICPLLPRSQTLDRGAAGGGRITVDLEAAAHPLLTHRRELQLGNPFFLAERVDEAIVAAIDAFYTTSPARRALIRYYDMPAVADAYGAWTHALATHADATASVFPEGSADRAAVAAVYPAAGVFVEGCLGVGAGAAASAPAPLPGAKPPGALNRSLMYRLLDLFRYPVSQAEFGAACGKQLAALDATSPAVRAETLAQLRGIAAAVGADGDSTVKSESGGGEEEPPSKMLLRIRSAIVARPWRYATVSRLLADASYITALPLLPSVALSLIVDGERESRVVALSRLALGLVSAPQSKAAAAGAAMHEAPGASRPSVATDSQAAPASSPSSAAAQGEVRVLEPLLAATDVRVTELARLPLATVIALRESPAAVAFRAAVAKLRRRVAIGGSSSSGAAADGRSRLARAGSAGALHDLASPLASPGPAGAASGSVGGAGAGPTATGTPVAGGGLAAPGFSFRTGSRLRREHSASGSAPELAPSPRAGAGGDGATLSSLPSPGPLPLLRHSSSTSGGASSADAEARLTAAAQEAAVALCEQLRAHLVPVDQRPLPALDLTALESIPVSLAACVARTRARSAAAAASAAGGAAATSSAESLLACAPHVTPSLWQLLRGGVTVCRGEPIPPTFSIPLLGFPALVPVVKPSGPSHASLSATAAAAAAAGPAASSAASAVAAAPASASAAVAAAAAASEPSAASAPSPTEETAAAKPPVECLERVLAYSDPANKWVSLRFDRVRFPSGAVGRHNVVVEFGARTGRPGVCILPLTPDRHILMLRQYRYTVGRWSWEIPRGGPELGRAPDAQALAELEEETGFTVRPPAGTALPAGVRPRLVRLAAGFGGAASMAGSSAGDAAAGAGGGESASAAPAPAAAPLPAVDPLRVQPANGPGLLWPNAGISDTSVAFFAAVDVVPLPSGARPEETEVISRVRPVPVEHVYALLRRGALRDQFTVAAVGMAIVHGLLPPPDAGDDGDDELLGRDMDEPEDSEA